MWRIIITGFLCGAAAVPLFHEGTQFLLYHQFPWLKATLGAADGFRPLAPGFSLRLSPPLGFPEVLNLAFWGGCWGVLLAAVLRLLPAPALLAGFLFGSLVCTAFGFAPHYGERGLPFWTVLYLPNWLRIALVNGAWGWGAAALMRTAGLGRRFQD
jgi:hypothetical protein